MYRSSVLALTALAILLLSACGDDEGADPVATATASVEAPAAAARPPAAVEEEGWFLRTVAPLGDDRGMCIDLPGWTPSNIVFDVPVQTHTCKHGWWNHDGRFDRAAIGDGRVEMPFFERCLEAASAEQGARFFVMPCDGGERQHFQQLESGQIVLEGSPELCVSIPDEPHRDAGGDSFWANGLVLEMCSDGAAERQRWAFTEPL